MTVIDSLFGSYRTDVLYQVEQVFLNKLILNFFLFSCPEDILL